MLTLKLVTTTTELEGIKSLQTQNLGVNLTKEEAVKEGFVTASYTLEFLQAMHNQAPSVIAKVNDEVVGYALVATKAIRYEHDLLADLFNAIDKETYKGNLLQNENYVVVGQLCVGKNYRGQGMVQQLYNYYKNAYNAKFSYLVTDVAKANPRSLKAHIKTGFEVINTLEYGGIGWDIVLWDWRPPTP